MERTIRKDGRLYRYIYHGVPEASRPKEINICQLGADLSLTLIRDIIVTMVIWYFAYLLGSSVWVVFIGDSYVPILTELLGIVAFGTCLAILGGSVFSILWVLGLLRWAGPIQLLVDYVRAKKEKYCPVYKVV